MNSNPRHIFLLYERELPTPTTSSSPRTEYYVENAAVSRTTRTNHFIHPISSIEAAGTDEESEPRNGFTACAPSRGTLLRAPKVQYFVYRFILFTDGSIFLRKEGSGDGVYMQCLNLPWDARNCPEAIRVLAIAPPGVLELLLSAILSTI